MNMIDKKDPTHDSLYGRKEGWGKRGIRVKHSIRSNIPVNFGGERPRIGKKKGQAGKVVASKRKKEHREHISLGGRCKALGNTFLNIDRKRFFVEKQPVQSEPKQGRKGGNQPSLEYGGFSNANSRYFHRSQQGFFGGADGGKGCGFLTVKGCKVEAKDLRREFRVRDHKGPGQTER